MSDKIASECCGSCDHYDLFIKIKCWDCGLNIADKKEGVSKPIVEDICNRYSPRDPIDNPYQKMWEELKRDIYKEKGNPIVLDVDRIGIQNYVELLQEKHK